MRSAGLREWRHHLVALSEVDPSPPQWVVPGLLPPGMTLLAGAPKTKKSTLAMAIAGALTEGVPVQGCNHRPPKERGTVLVVAYEQSARRLRYVYEQRIIKRPVKKGGLNVLFVKDAYEWQIDEPRGDKDLESMMADLRPTVTVLDPLAQAHAQDENDPRMVRPLVPLRALALKYGLSLLVVHHANKRKQENGQAAPGDFDRVRGSTALWAMADAGHLVTKHPSGRVMVTSEFKDFKPYNWLWKAP